MATTGGEGKQRTAKRTGQGAGSNRSAAAAEPGGAESTHGTTLRLPFVTARFTKPAGFPGRNELTSAAAAVRSQLPPRDQAFFYGALAAGTALSLLEWPVALAIGAGSALARSERGSGAANRKQQS